VYFWVSSMFFADLGQQHTPIQSMI